MSLETMAQGIQSRSKGRAVRISDRIFDAAAVLLLVVGIGFFATGRSSLSRLATGEFERQDGVSMVEIAERHDAQTRLGLWLIGSGLVAGVVAASRYRFSRG